MDETPKPAPDPDLNSSPLVTREFEVVETVGPPSDFFADGVIGMIANDLGIVKFNFYKDQPIIGAQGRARRIIVARVTMHKNAMRDIGRWMINHADEIDKLPQFARSHDGSSDTQD